MTISPEVQQQFFFVSPDGTTSHVIRLPPADVANPERPSRRVGKPWTTDEHDRFLEGLQLHPSGPWRLIASHVGTRTTRQTMTHAQKYRERISRLLVPLHLLHAPSSPQVPESLWCSMSCPRSVALSSLTPHYPPQHAGATTATTTTTTDASENAHALFDGLDLEILSRLLLDDNADGSDGSVSPSSCDSHDDPTDTSDLETVWCDQWEFTLP